LLAGRTAQQIQGLQMLDRPTAAENAPKSRTVGEGSNVQYAWVRFAEFQWIPTVTAPSTTRPSDTFSVTVRQLSWAQSVGEAKVPTAASLRHAEETAGPAITSRSYRRVIGAFQLTVPAPANGSRLTEERTLALYRWLLQQMPTSRRWHPVFARFVEQVAQRVTAYGGDPRAIPPSPIGALPWHDWPQGPDSQRAHSEHFGKIRALIFDHFGDFAGFSLEDDHGDECEFRSREMRVLRLAREAEECRTFCAVRSEGDGRLRSIRLHARLGRKPHATDH
jgi:hypothetical protein